jgi:hypothetical protein
MNLTPDLFILGAALVAAVGAWALGHYGTSGLAAKIKGAEQAATASFLAHPLQTIQSAEHAAAQEASDLAGRAIAYLLDVSPEDAKIELANAVKAAKAKARADILAKLQ